MGILNPFRFGQRSAGATTVDAVEQDLRMRSVRIDQSQLNESERTIPAILATETPVPIWDYESGRQIDEVLQAEGGSFPERMPFLDSHMRWSTDTMHGSVRNIRRDGDKWRGVVHFAKDVGEGTERLFQMVRQGHLEDGSIGYRYERGDWTDIEPGQTRNVRGKTYTAGKRMMRVVTLWRGHEYSAAAIGADSESKLGRNLKPGAQETEPKNSEGQGQRTSDSSEHPQELKMNKQLREYLVSLGMRADASDEQARSYFEALGDEARARGERIERGEEQFTPGTRTGDRSSGDDPPSDGQRTQPTGQTTPPVTGDQQGQRQGSVDDYQRAAADEMDRRDYIRGFEGQVPPEMITRAINERWNRERADSEFLTHFRNREEPVAGGHVGIHDGSANRQATVQALQAAFLMKGGRSLDSNLFDCPQVQHAFRSTDCNAEWWSQARRAHAAGGRLTDDASRALDVAQNYRNASYYDLVREMLTAEGVRYDRFDDYEIWRRSLTSASVSTVFTTHFSAELLAGFMGKVDTTVGWVREVDVPNLMENERKQVGKMTRPKRRVAGQKAEPVTFGAVGEKWRAYEYAADFFVDFQDFLNDRLGAMDQTPTEMGEAMAEVRPDLVYYLLMSNPTMLQDSKAVFHADHNNLETSSALSFETLDKMKVNMRTHRVNGRLINTEMRGLIVPELKESLAIELTGSQQKRNTTSDTEYGVNNWANGRFNVVAEPRLDVGVTDPITGTVQAAKTGSTYGVAENGRYGIEVGYVRGTGRRPRMRPYIATEGRFGRGWDIQFLIGAGIVGYQGLQEARA